MARSLVVLIVAAGVFAPGVVVGVVVVLTSTFVPPVVVVVVVVVVAIGLVAQAWSSLTNDSNSRSKPDIFAIAGGEMVAVAVAVAVVDIGQCC